MRTNSSRSRRNSRSRFHGVWHAVCVHCLTLPCRAGSQVKTSFVLDPQEGAYKFTVELPLAIDVVALQSSIPISILDAETNAAIVSRSPPVKYARHMLSAV